MWRKTHMAGSCSKEQYSICGKAGEIAEGGETEKRKTKAEIG
jgi:hypothetical protein